ncbi:hypothetical protein [Niameybacter massiliensis]|uniref:hypothetical protein n=1 Tax=Niameybacter massiliensis TaxID=1658108 RepID=UPI0006B4456B|nr:hypothetical protein [Niameybacter massiliensis]
MRWMLTDFKRGLAERSFLFALVLGCLGMLGSLVVYILQNETYTATEAFKASHSLIVPFIAPLLAALPYSNMTMLEEDCGYKKLLMLRNQGRDYTLKRWWVNNLISGITLLIPSLLLMLACRSFSSYDSYKMIGEVVVLNFVFGVVYGSLAYSLTFVNQKRYIPLITPQVLYLLFIYAFPYLNLEKYFPPLAFSPWIMPSVVEGQLLMMQLGITFAVSCMVILAGSLYRKGVAKWLQ